MCKEPGTATENAESKPIVLLVDDNPLNIDVLANALTNKYQIKVANNGLRALELVQGKTPPALVLLDIMMPDMDGYEVCLQIKALPILSRIPIIFVSAMTSTANKVYGFSIGAADYITKPFDVEEVKARVAIHLELSRLQHHFEQALSQRTSALKESREKYRILAEYSPNWEYWLNQQSEYLYVSPACVEVSGYQPEEFITNAGLMRSIVHPDDLTLWDAHVLSESSIVSAMEPALNLRIINQRGDVRWIEHICKPVLDENGQYLGSRGTNRDITERKLSRAELQLARHQIQEVQNQLVQSEKMASIGQLAAGVAHEINNPIGYISSNLVSLKGYLEDLFGLISLYEANEANGIDAELLQQIQNFKQQIDLEFLKTDMLDLLSESREGAMRVKKIVHDLKDFSHVGGDDDWQWVNLHVGLESTLNIVHNEIKYKARVVKEFADIPDINCLPHQLNQVFMNLLVNAAHAIEKDGIITVRTRLQDSKVLVEVSDNGSGISPQHLNKIFDPFFTTKPVGKGTGLGLSVSYNIIKKHNGEIQVISKPGEGTTFRILLPINNAAA